MPDSCGILSLPNRSARNFQGMSAAPLCLPSFPTDHDSPLPTLPLRSAVPASSSQRFLPWPFSPFIAVCQYCPVSGSSLPSFLRIRICLRCFFQKFGIIRQKHVHPVKTAPVLLQPTGKSQDIFRFPHVRQLLRLQINGFIRLYICLV